MRRLELKIRELESKLELEVTIRGRLDTQITRLKEQLEKTTKECEELRMRDQASQEAQKKLSRQLRDLKEDLTTVQGKEAELMQKRGDLEKQLELAEAETLTVRYRTVQEIGRYLTINAPLILKMSIMRENK